MGEGQIEILEMEGALRADATGDYRRGLVARVAEARARLKASINRGLTPDEFEIANRLLGALNSAEQVLEAFWAKNHPEPK